NSARRNCRRPTPSCKTRTPTINTSLHRSCWPIRWHHALTRVTQFSQGRFPPRLGLRGNERQSLFRGRQERFRSNGLSRGILHPQVRGDIAHPCHALEFRAGVSRFLHLFLDLV